MLSSSSFHRWKQIILNIYVRSSCFENIIIKFEFHWKRAYKTNEEVKALANAIIINARPSYS